MRRFRSRTAGAIPVLPAAEGRGFFIPAPALQRRVTPTILLSALLFAAPAAAQRPGEIAGVILDAATSAPLDGADIRLQGLQRSAASDAAGRFVLRGLEPGDWMLRIDRLGFASREVPVRIRNGETLRLTVRLAPQPFALHGIEAAPGDAPSDGIRIDRTHMDRNAARTAGDAIRDVPGVTIRSTGPGSPQFAVIRGMAPDAVLVLVDGVPLNDAVTGEADLSAIDASAIASITVLPGARSARWGPRAAAGVILIETLAGAGADRRLGVGIGSLGTRDAAAAWSGEGHVEWTAGAALREQDGAFDFALPDAAGGGVRRRENADSRSGQIHAAAAGDLAAGRLETRLGYDALERGLPGRSFAPSRHARQRSDRAQASIAWRQTRAVSTVALLFAAAHQRLASRDSAPPFGLPYDDTTRATFLEGRLDIERAFDEVTAGAGIELRHRHIGGTLLRGDAPAMQLDAGLFVHADAPIATLGGAPLRLAVQTRLDRDPLRAGAVGSHSATLGWAPGRVALHLAHRSSYSPPTLGDLFFRDAWGIQPRPDLQAERVPGEVEAGASVGATLGTWAGTLRAAAYRGDVRGMIVWTPDHRFIWRPTNQDARRSGAEASLEAVAPGGGARLAAAWTYARITYDRGGGDRDVQIAYRPRHAATLEAAVRFVGTRLDARARYTGGRTTAPSAVNTLPGFWSVDAGASHERRIGTWRVGLDLRIERLFDNDDALVFGFPEPGRVARFGVRLSPARIPSTYTIGVQR